MPRRMPFLSVLLRLAPLRRARARAMDSRGRRAATLGRWQVEDAPRSPPRSGAPWRRTTRSQRTGIPVDEVLGSAREEAAARARSPGGMPCAPPVCWPPAAWSRPPRRAPRRPGRPSPTSSSWAPGWPGCGPRTGCGRSRASRARSTRASTRLGGRCWTLRDHFPGYVVEHGGALINTDHNAVRNLARSLGPHPRHRATAAATPAGSTSTGSTARTTPTTRPTPTGGRSGSRSRTPSRPRRTRRPTTRGPRPGGPSTT